MGQGLIPAIALKDLQAMKPGQLRAMKCCEVTHEGEYIATIVIPRTDHVRMQTEYLGEKSNSVGGINPPSATIEAPPEEYVAEEKPKPKGIRKPADKR